MQLALFGYGRMGRAVDVVARERGHEISLVLEVNDNRDGEGITRSALAGAEVAVDFSAADAVLANIRKASECGIGVVVGTTGWEQDRARVEEAVRERGTALLHAPNFSVGMLFFTRVVEAAARMINGIDDYDVHLWEVHHRHKVDHPGGTARRLADTLVRELDRKDAWTTELLGDEPIDPRALQVAVGRVGEVPGLHAIGLEGPDDRIELRHEARSRNGFARGAVLAAEWLDGRSGVFTMDDLMNDLLGGAGTR